MPLVIPVNWKGCKKRQFEIKTISLHFATSELSGSRLEVWNPFILTPPRFVLLTGDIYLH